MLAQQVFNLEKSLQVTEAQFFGFFRTRHNEAIVVRKHDDGFTTQIGSKYLLATGVETIAIN